MVDKAKKEKEIEKRPQGRPTKWEPRFNDEIVEYFSILEPYKVSYDTKGKPLFEPARMRFFQDFAAMIGVNEDTMIEWGKPENIEKYPGFSVAYARAKKLQEKQLVECGLVGAYNPQFAIFFAKNATSLRDIQENRQVDGKGNDVYTPEMLEKIRANVRKAKK